MQNDEIIEMLSHRNYIAYADIIDTAKMDGSDILYCSEKGVAIRNPSSTLMAASFSEDASWIDPYLDAELIAAHGHELYSHLLTKGYTVEEPCSLFVYDGKPFAADYSQIRLLTDEYAYKAGEQYHGRHDYIKERIASGRLWGIFLDGALSGFAGFHDEGAMGMLEILPEFRRHHLGQKLEMFLIDKAMEEGRKAYCNVYASNKASAALQEKLGLKRGDILTWWMWRA